MDSSYSDVIIIGGGAAGIGVAHELLKDSKMSWRLLEARDQLCGRIQKIRIDGKDVDTGAYELAGFREESELISMVKQGFCKISLREDLTRIIYVDQLEGEFTNEEMQSMQDIFREFEDFIRTICKESDRIITLEEGIQRFKQSNEKFIAQPNKMKRLFDLKINMIEHEECGDKENLPALETATLAEGMQEDFIDIQPIPEETYHGVMAKFVSMFPKQCITCSSVVLAVRRKQNGLVEVTSKQKVQSQGEWAEKVYTCKKVVCAVPLNVLKSEKIQFEPPLPKEYREGIENLGYGIFQKIILAFQKPFWPADTQRIKIANQVTDLFPHFLNLSGPKDENPQEIAHILIGFMTSKKAREVWQKYSKKEIAEQAVAHFIKLYPKDEIVLKDWHVTDWGNTEHINQSFSHFLPKGTVEMTKNMRKGIDQWLWLAGEYMFGENMGCAHGAFALGSRAAKDILAKQQGA